MQISRYNIQVIDTFENDRVLAEERTEAGKPKLQYNGSDDKYPPIITSELTFNFSVPGAQDGKFFHLFTGNDNRYFVRLLDQDDAILWTGFLMPDQYSEPYKAGHLFVDMTATDGIGRLKGKILGWDYYNSETSVIKLIAECLKLTGLSQYINFSPAILPAANDYRWDEIYVDGTVYRDDDEIIYGVWGTILKYPKRKNAYEILELLLKSIGCTVFNWKNEWHIVGINRKHETEYEALRYTPEGVYDGVANKTREVRNVVFETTPTVRVTSPWKRVNITWAIDEDGQLLPDDIISEAPGAWSVVTGNAILDNGPTSGPNDAPMKYWERHGAIGASLASANGESLVDWSVVGSIPVPVPQGPYNFRVARSINNSAGFVVSGETTEGTNVNYVQLKKPKYLKKSDEYIVRWLSVNVSLFGAGGSQDTVDNGDARDLYRCELTLNDTVLVSNRPGGPGAINFKFEIGFRPGSMEIVEENPGDQNIYITTARQLTGDLEKENITLPNNGFLNIKFFGPVSPDPLHPILVGYTFSKLEMEYTAQDEWFHSLVRGIDFTTVYDLEYFHGDSIQDLSKKQFRFKRYVPFTASVVNITPLSSFYDDGGWFGVPRYVFTLSYQQAQLILQQPQLLSVVWDTGTLTINQLYEGATVIPYGILWGLNESNGVWYLNMILGTHPIFGDIANFSNLFLNTVGDTGQTGWLPEDNEWRESWKRYGYDENRRHGVCLGRIYHDVQPEPLVTFEGDVFGIFGPDELLRKRWIVNRTFIPLRFTMDFSKGKTTGVVMMESTINNVSDYGTE